jgi:hypothetical protein
MTESPSSLYAFDRIADRIKQARQVSSAPAVVVEGKGDRRFLSRLSALRDADVYIAGTRDRVLTTAHDVVQLSLSRVVCVVDRDFDDVVSQAEVDLAVLIAYDNADLEAMLWTSAALEALLEEVGSEEKLEAFGGTEALRDAVNSVLAPVCRLRRANALEGWGLPFDAVDLASKIDLRTLSLSVQSLCDALWRPDLGVAKSQLYEVAADGSVPTCPHSGAELIRGKDAVAVTGVALRRLIGSLTHQQASGDRLEETLRLASSDAHVSTTRWLSRVGAAL